MAQTAERTANLIAYTVSEDHQRPDLEACLEISDRVNSLKTECIEAVMTITKCMAKPSYKIQLNTVQLLETLCKNCNMRFLYELNNKKLVDALMKVLSSRRERTKKPKSSKPVDKLKIQVEDKILYLIQLWADTFMMHQEEFKNIHEAYRILRKEGVKFPDRDPNEKFMMNFQGTISPIFLAMDENYIVPSNNQGGPVPEPKREVPQSNIKEPEYHHEVIASSRPPAQLNTLYNEDEEYDYSVYDGVEITKDEMKIVEESISILKEIEANAVKPGDMKSEIANEILGDLVHVNKRVRRIILTDKFSSTVQRSDAMKLNDMINDCLTSYRTRYNLIKNNYSKGIKTEPLVKQPEPQPQTEVGGFLDEEDHARANKFKQEGQQLDILKTEESADGKKSGFTSVRKLAPPKGWKAPPQATNIDLLDLLDAEIPQMTPIAESKEETKQDTPQSQNNNVTPKNYMDDLLSLDIGGGNAHQNQNQQKNQSHNSNVNAGFNFGNNGQQQANANFDFMGSWPSNNNPQQFVSAPGGFQNFNSFNQQAIPNPNNFASMPDFFGSNNAQVNNNNTNQNVIDFNFGQVTTNQKSEPQALSPANQQPQSAGNKAAAPVDDDDDDFFSGVANRNK